MPAKDNTLISHLASFIPLFYPSRSLGILNRATVQPMMRFFIPLTVSVLTTLCAAHGIVTYPPVREPGPASLAACGPAVTSIIKSDNQTGTEVLHKVSGTDAKFQPEKCNIALCKGLQLEDNLSNVQTYKPGQVVDFTVWTRIPHKGWASVAIVDATTPYPNALIGSSLLSFETDSVSGFSHELEEQMGEELKTEMAPVDMEFNVTIPRELNGRCGKAGECVSWWFPLKMESTNWLCRFCSGHGLGELLSRPMSLVSTSLSQMRGRLRTCDRRF